VVAQANIVQRWAISQQRKIPYGSADSVFR